MKSRVVTLVAVFTGVAAHSGCEISFFLELKLIDQSTSGLFSYK